MSTLFSKNIRPFLASALLIGLSSFVISCTSTPTTATAEHHESKSFTRTNIIKVKKEMIDKIRSHDEIEKNKKEKIISILENHVKELQELRKKEASLSHILLSELLLKKDIDTKKVRQLKSKIKINGN